MLCILLAKIFEQNFVREQDAVHLAASSASIRLCRKMKAIISLPPGGKVDKAKLWTNEGRNLFLR